MSNTVSVTRSKIYTYFYGRRTVFQQFLIIVGVLFLMLSGVSGRANEAGHEKEYDKLREEYRDAGDEYNDALSEAYRYFDEVRRGKELDVDKDDDNYDVARDYNKALEAYEKAEKKLDDFRDKDPSENFMGAVCTFLGWVCIVAGFGWIIYKKLSFNRDGEQEYDEELKRCVEEAKKKGMDKLNIISDQIERVEPVVLNGVAYVGAGNTANLARSGLAGFFAGIAQFVLRFDVLILGIIAVGIFTAIASAIAQNMIVFILLFLVALGGAGALGFLLFKRYETESYVSPRVIKRLTKFPPVLMSKLGSDDAVRVSLPAITVYMFGDDQLYVYYQYIDIVTGKIFCEGVNEYFYEDIVGVTSSQETKKIFKRCGFMKLFLKSIDYLKESITVVTSGCTHSESYIVDVGGSLLDTSFIGMRNLIRQKKAEK